MRSFMLGVYSYQEFKNLVRIKNKKVSCIVAIPVIKIKNKFKGIIIDFQYNNEYIIFRCFVPLPVNPTTEQINTAIKQLYKNFCSSILN